MLIPLRNRTGETIAHALVDEDCPYTHQRWSIANSGYVQGWVNGELVHLQRLLLGLEVGDKRKADHINRNKLDNRRVNLRIVTDAESSQNSERQTWRGRPVASPYRGVHKNKKRWSARVKINGVNHNLGTFDTDIEAAEVARSFRLTHMSHSGD